MRLRSKLLYLKQKKKQVIQTCFLLARHEGLEPPTFAFVVRDSIQLS